MVYLCVEFHMYACVYVIGLYMYVLLLSQCLVEWCICVPVHVCGGCRCLAECLAGCVVGVWMSGGIGVCV